MDMKLILCPTDGSAEALKAIDLAADLATSKKASVVCTYVQTSHGGFQIPPGLEEYAKVEHVRVTEADVLRSAAQRIADDGVRRLRDRGVSEVEALVLEGDPARKIVETAKSRGVDAIVMGSRGLGDMEGLLLGSVSHKVAHLAPCTVVVAR